MAHRVRVGSDGHLEVVRLAPPEDAARLRRTADALRAAADAGAVEVRAVTDAGGEVEVVLAYAGRAPVAPLAAPQLARVGATLAAHLADLHARGMAHGAIEVDHVLLDADGLPRLCGFGATDHASAHGDVGALGELLLGLLGDDDRTPEAEAVRATATRCVAPESTGRPTMAAVAASLASIPAPSRRAARTPRATSARPRVPIAIALAATMAIGAVAVAVARPSATPRAHPSTTWRSTTTTTTTATTTTAARAARVWPPVEPRSLEVDGQRWTFGSVDDTVVMGDWDGDGSPTPALVERDGDVWVIDAWPAGDQATARYVENVGAATGTEVEHDGRFDVLVVILASGEVVRLTPRLEA